MKWGSTLDLLLDIVYPRDCLLCASRIHREPFRGACGNCLEGLVWSGTALCRCCSAPMSQSSLCPACTQNNFAFASVWSLGPYQDHLKKLIHAFKFERDRGVGRDIALFMARSEELLELLRSTQVLVPVPMHPLKERNRGYNQAKILAEELAEIAGIPMLDNVLIKTKTSVPQMELDRQARWKNVADSFTIGTLPKGGMEEWDVVLIDDVLTTGATAHRCAEILRKAGAERVRVVVAARSVMEIQ